MSEDWKTEPLGKYCYIKARIGWRGLSASEYTASGPYLIAGKHVQNGIIDWNTCDHISEFRYRESSEIALADGDVIVTKDGTIGRVARIDSLPGEATINGTMMLIRPLQEIDYRFLSHVLTGHDFKKLIDDKVSGSSIPHIFQRDMVTLSISFPTIDYQRKIADILDTLDSAIRQTEAVIGKLKAVKIGLLHDLLTRGIAANGELRPPPTEAPKHYKQSPWGCIPHEWEAARLGDITSWTSGGTPSRSVPSNWVGDIALLTPKDMKVFELSDTSEHVSLNAANVGSRLMPAGTVFIVVRGMILAHSFPVVLAKRSMAFNQDIKAVTAGPKVNPRFLAHWFVANSSEFLKKVTEATHGTKKLDMEYLVGMPIGLPPLAEQIEIVARQTAIEQKIETEVEFLAKLLAFKSGLMDDLLTGHVRVKPRLAQTAQDALEACA